MLRKRKREHHAGGRQTREKMKGGSRMEKRIAQQGRGGGRNLQWHEGIVVSNGQQLNVSSPTSPSLGELTQCAFHACKKKFTWLHGKPLLQN